ncbi:MAG: hypothetical protein ABIP21_05275 [Acidimicrobiia bacterium]
MNTNRIKRPEARVLAEEEFVRFAATVASLTPEEWATDTDCRAPEVAADQAGAAGFAMVQCRNERLQLEFFDVGAMVST